MQRQGQVVAPTPCRVRFPQTISIQKADVTLITGMQPVIVPLNNAEDDKEEENKSIYNRSKLDREDNAFVDFQNNNHDSDKYKDGNSGDDTIFVDNLVWEDIANYIVIPDISDHYCGPHGFKEGAEKLLKTVLE